MRGERNGTNGRQPANVLRLARTRKLSEIEPEALEWEWRDRIPKGKVTLIVGDPGVAKSLLTTFIAACKTTGRPWPDDPPGTMRRPAQVIWLSAEDDASDTIRPRIDAAGGDPDLITILDGIKTVELDDYVDPEAGPSASRREQEAEFSLANDIPVLEQEIIRTGATLIIVDPLTAYLGETDSFKDADVRRVLRPLSELAAKYGVTIIAVMHLNKAMGKAAQYRVSGSVAFVAAARAVHLVAIDPDDKEKRVFLPLKQNLSKAPDGLKFKLETYPMIYKNRQADPARLVWLAESVTTSLDEALDPGQGGGQALDQAVAFLLETLGEGPQLSRAVHADATELDISKATLRRAMEKLGVIHRKLKKDQDPKTPFMMWLPDQEQHAHEKNREQHTQHEQDEHVVTPEQGELDQSTPKGALLARSLPAYDAHDAHDAHDFMARAREQDTEHVAHWQKDDDDWIPF